MEIIFTRPNNILPSVRYTKRHISSTPKNRIHLNQLKLMKKHVIVENFYTQRERHKDKTVGGGGFSETEITETIDCLNAVCKHIKFHKERLQSPKPSAKMEILRLVHTR